MTTVQRVEGSACACSESRKPSSKQPPAGVVSTTAANLRIYEVCLMCILWMCMYTRVTTIAVPPVPFRKAAGTPHERLMLTTAVVYIQLCLPSQTTHTLELDV